MSFFKVKVSQFEGPLDLLLQLIEERKLTITEIALADVTEQYIKILDGDGRSTIQTEQLADFLVIAARLLLLKSRALLPFLQWDEEEDGAQLAKQLRIYKQYLEASKKLQTAIGKKQFAYRREKLLVGKDVGFAPPEQLKAKDLAATFAEILRTLEPNLNAPTEVIERTINLEERIASIKEQITRKLRMNFSEILQQAKNKTEVIVTFVALLELMKQKTVLVKQVENFSDIEIEKV